LPYPVKNNLKCIFKSDIIHPRIFSFHLIGERAPRDITLSTFNWSNGKIII